VTDDCLAEADVHRLLIWAEKKIKSIMVDNDLNCDPQIQKKKKSKKKKRELKNRKMKIF